MYACLMDILSIYNNLWCIVETIALLMVIFIFFKDPIRRWNFFGYRPTAIMGLLDCQTGQVVLVRKEGDLWWAFSQGGIYNDDINCTVQDILKRELGLEPTSFGLRYTEELGVIRIHDPELLHRATLNSICITSKLRGKGYIACYIRCNMNEIAKQIKKGEGILDAQIMTIQEARQKILEQGSSRRVERSGAKKQQMVLHILDEMDKLVLKRQKKKEEEKSPKQDSSQ